MTMQTRISVRLDEDVRSTLASAAAARGIGLSALLRELATAEARRIRRERIRVQTREVAERIATSAAAAAFYRDWS